MAAPSPTALHPTQSIRSSIPDIPEYYLRPTTSNSGVSLQVEVSPAYLIEWNTQTCVRTFLSTVEELRTEIRRGKADHVERLFVIHGLPVDYVKAIRNSLDIDPAFIEAHAGRRRYRPLRWRKEATFAHYEFPELVKGYRAVGMGGMVDDKGTKDVDLMRDPEIRAVSEDGDTAAVFCHASLWINTRADVLFLDRPVWRDPTSPLRKARRDASVTKPYQIRPGSNQEKKNAFDIRLAEGDEIRSLEDVLHETLKDAADVGEDLLGIISGLAYDHWLEFFEVLSPQPFLNSHGDIQSLFWDTAQSLEQNLDVANYLSRQNSQPQSVLYPNWDALLSRLQRRADLLALTRPKAALSKSSTAKKLTRANTLASSSRSGGNKWLKPPLDDENHRALNRVSYMGGILLPFSIVSGILSMSDPFSAIDGYFWVFWAAAVPLALISIFVIYADIIRKAEVWVEVAAEGVQNAIAKSPMLGKAQTGSGKWGSAQPAMWTWYRLGEGSEKMNGKSPEVDRPKPALYSAGDEAVVIDMPLDMDEEAQLRDELEEAEEDFDGPAMILERRSDGSKPKAWRRQQLGWYGAVKAIVGYSKPRRVEDIPFGVAAEKRKTRTFPL